MTLSKIPAQVQPFLEHLLLKDLVLEANGRGGLEQVWSVLTETLPITGSLAWRVGALRDHGIEPSEYCVEEPADLSLQISGSGI